MPAQKIPALNEKEWQDIVMKTVGKLGLIENCKFWNKLRKLNKIIVINSLARGV